MSEYVMERVIAGALFDIMGWLTSRDEVSTFSASHDASPAVEALTEWAKLRGLSLDEADVKGWRTAAAAAAPREPAPSVGEAELEFARVASRLLHGFMLDTNAVGVHGAGENLAKGIKQYLAIQNRADANGENS